jgi:hypothetical protein
VSFTITIVLFYQFITNILIRAVKIAYNEAWEALQGWSSEGSDGGDPNSFKIGRHRKDKWV